MYRKYFKRLLDIVLSLFGLVILSPVFIIVTVLLFFSNKGKPFFSQERPGKDEKTFKLCKFKSMNDKKDANGILLPDAERLTSIGKFIRQTSVDELPQLYNILKGDMSLIGPRPLLVEYLPYYTDSEKIRHKVRPGITGYAQVNGRNRIEWDERLRMDVLYVKNLSFYMDMSIFIKTIAHVLNGKDISINNIDNLDNVRKI
jgi:lipopolysaccharide/colanic/teichoic acid biosynthesis glycosyltransferase